METKTSELLKQKLFIRRIRATHCVQVLFILVMVSCNAKYNIDPESLGWTKGKWEQTLETTLANPPRIANPQPGALGIMTAFKVEELPDSHPYRRFALQEYANQFWILGSYSAKETSTVIIDKDIIEIQGSGEEKRRINRKGSEHNLGIWLSNVHNRISRLKPGATEEIDSKQCKVMVLEKEGAPVLKVWLWSKHQFIINLEERHKNGDVIKLTRNHVELQP